MANRKIERPKRTPIKGRNVLTVAGKEDGFHYRFVNRIGDRVEMMKERGWEVVDKAAVRVGDRRVATPSAEGSVAEAHVGDGMKAIVMRIPDELYNEDQAMKQREIDDMEDALRNSKDHADFGSVKIEKG